MAKKKKKNPELVVVRNKPKKKAKKKNPEIVIVKNAQGKNVNIPKEALDRFYKIHGKGAPLHVKKVTLPKGMTEGQFLVEIGEAVRTDYKPPKGSKKYPHEYFHEHGEESGTNPHLVTTPDGKTLLILRKKGNRMRVEEWIHD